MARPVLVLAGVLAPLLCGAQVTVTAPGAPQNRASDKNYGKPRVVDLGAILISDGYQRAHVIVEGELNRFLAGDYWTLGKPGSQLLVIKGYELDPSELDRLVGHRVEIRGIVRFIREKESMKGVDLDLIEDPTLPPLPPPMFDQGWPRISLTALETRDREYPGRKRQAETSAGFAREILDDPGAYLGKKTRVYGQFRGNNLFGDLPPNTARDKGDWVLKDGDTALWVVGKEPKGEGWKLNLDYRGDSKNWLEVEGKPEVENGILYFKASKVLMSKAPPSDSSDRP